MEMRQRKDKMLVLGLEVSVRYLLECTEVGFLCSTSSETERRGSIPPSIFPTGLTWEFNLRIKLLQLVPFSLDRTVVIQHGCSLQHRFLGSILLPKLIWLFHQTQCVSSQYQRRNGGWLSRNVSRDGWISMRFGKIWMLLEVTKVLVPPFPWQAVKQGQVLAWQVMWLADCLYMSVFLSADAFVCLILLLGWCFREKSKAIMQLASEKE